MSSTPEKLLHLNLPIIKLFLLWFCSVTVCMPVTAQIISSPTVQVNMLEVYTSQGCSSCPPAERWMSQFKKDFRLWKKLVPMNFHVDYWDYLGWSDPYASKIFTNRQRSFKSLGLSPTVATPGFIVAGKGWNGWFRGRPVPIKTPVDVGVLTANVLTENAEEMKAEVSFHPTQNVDKALLLHVAILGFDQLTKVMAGENSGKELPHDFVVLGYNRSALEEMNNKLSAQIKLPEVSQFNSPRKALVFWVSRHGDPTPIQVAADWYF
ncbi:MAG: DUF1223 domain-containing protein [Pseudomonadales bacterium]|nr:DUF1223 domain-containing protein [Pseudomonadales bacterium]